jgi:putative membrane protein
LPVSSAQEAGPSSALDPDARFLLANERTLLAWIRTALTLQAAGLGVLQFVTEVEARGLIGLALLALGAAAGLVGYRRYRAADLAIRQGRLPRKGAAPELVALAVVALAVILAVAYVGAQVAGD